MRRSQAIPRDFSEIEDVGGRNFLRGLEEKLPYNRAHVGAGG
jgi:hypothetical protein